MEHFGLKYKQKIKTIAWECFVKKRSNEEKMRKLFIGKLPEEDWVKKSKDLILDALCLIQINQSLSVN